MLLYFLFSENILFNFVLFISAIPFQGWMNHINERPQSYWIKNFQERGFKCLDIIRPNFWDNENVGVGYKQNCFLFVNREKYFDEYFKLFQ